MKLENTKKLKVSNKLNIEQTNIDGLFIIEPNKFSDERGSFTRIFCQNELQEIFKDNNIKQVNHSITNKKGAVRGLHFQYQPDCEIKMVRCIVGSILDFVVDIRQNSKTFLQCYSVKLSSNNCKMVFIPKGFAHGFQTLEDKTELFYFHSNLYSKNNEGALNLTDPLLEINLPLAITGISEKDKNHPFLDSNFTGIQI